MANPLRLPSSDEGVREAALAVLPKGVEMPWDETSFEDSRVSLFLRCVFFGHTILDATALSGWNPQAYSKYLKLGGSPRSQAPSDEPTEPYISFCTALEQAAVAAKSMMMSTVLAAAWSGDAKAAQFWLERRHRKEWGTGAVLPEEITGHKPVLHIHLPASGRDDPTGSDESVDVIVTTAEIQGPLVHESSEDQE